MTYLAQVSLYWLLLYACYWLVLRRHTFFVLNRVYLLGALGVAFILPQVPYPDTAPPVPRVVYEMTTQPMESIIVAPQNSMALPSGVTEPFPWGTFLWMVYGLVVLVMAVRLFRHIRQLLTFIQQGTCLEMDSYRLCLLENDHLGSFSFLNYIVINRTDYAENLDTILSHELVHVRQRHSWDVLLVEVLWVFFWFNPVLILYKKSLQQIHEYLVDQTAPQRDRYAGFLLAYALNSPANGLTNNFLNPSHLKNRITMLYKNRNSNWVLGKYAAVALLIGSVALLMAFKPANISEVSFQILQKVKVKGVVVDSDNKPLNNIVVKTSDSKISFLTDQSGEYEFSIPEGSELGFYSSRHKVVKVKVNDDHIINAVLAKASDQDASVANVYPFLEEKYIHPGEREFGQFIPRFMPKGDSSKAKGKEWKWYWLRDNDRQPSFPGGEQALRKFINQKVTYPANASRANVQGKVLLNFVISATGEIRNVEILKDPGFGLKEESLRLISAMPTWVPGQRDGHVVAMRYDMTLDFQLSDYKTIAPPEKVGTLETQVKPDTQGNSMAVIKYYPKYNRERRTVNYRIFHNDTLQNALYILNAMPMKNRDFMKDLTIDELQSVRVLNSSTARRLYGEKGANGVVQVFTKKSDKN